MTEFKQIPSAPLYEIDIEGYIQTVDKKSPIFPFPLNSKNVKLKVNGNRQIFNIDKLIGEAFSLLHKEGMIFKDKEEATEILTARQTCKVVEKTDEEKLKELPIIERPKDLNKNAIMALDTFTSVKIWKLFEAGFDKSEIMEIIGPPNNVNVSATIEKYKTNETLRERANKVSYGL